MTCIVLVRSKYITSGHEPKRCSSEEVKEETVTVIAVPVKGMVGQDKKMKKIFSREIQQWQKLHNYTRALMWRPHCICIAGFPPQITGTLSHLRVCSKRSNTSSLVFHSSCFQIPAFQRLPSTHKEYGSFPLLKLLSSFLAPGKKIYLYNDNSKSLQKFQTKAVCELDWW